MTLRTKATSVRQKSKSKKEGNFLSGNQPLEIIPAEVVFKDIEINQFYQITVEIRNLTNKATRIRIQKVENPKIQVLYSMQAEIAPGLSTTARIKYECNQLVSETDIIKIVNEQGHIVELPVRVYKMQSQIQFEPFVNMGFIRTGKQHEEVVGVKNLGKAPGTVEFTHDYGNVLSVDPKILKIAPKEQSKIVIKFKSNQAGVFKGFIQLKSDSILVKDQIDIHATTIDYARFVVDSKGIQTSSFDFGVMSVGEQVRVKAFIVNNSPKVMNFKTFFRKGFLTGVQQFAMVQTPSEIGMEQSERIIFCQPESGQIEAFSELQINLICKTKITYKDRVYTNSYALTPSEAENSINHKKNSNDFKPQNTYDYSVMLTCQGDQPILMQLKAIAVCPQIKISTNTFKFGDCPCHQSRSEKFTVENKNNSKTVISFQKIPNFSVIPQTYNLKPNQKMEFTLIFQPKSIGKVDTNQLLVINKLYEIQLRCFGISTSSSSSKIITPNKTRNKAFSLTDKTFTSKQINAQSHYDQVTRLKLSSLYQNKQKFNQYLVERRSQRKNQQKQEAVQKKWSLYQTKLRDLGINSRLEQRLDDQGLPVNPPIDYQFETGMLDTKLEKQFIGMPSAIEPLFVTRHIGQYQPPVTKPTNQKYSPDIMIGPKKVNPDTPQNYNHRRQISAQLSSNELQQIEVGTNVINFGDVYIKSKSSRYFWIRNSTKKAISVRIKIKDNQLDLSYKKPQIIQSGHEAGFELVFNKDTLGEFKSTMKYIINEIHQFQMTVTAKSVAVTLEIDRQNVKFVYDDNSLDMKKTQNITLYNPGNSDAFFKFTLTKEKYFLPQILERTIKSKEKLTIPINFIAPIPNAQKNQYNYSQKLGIKILDGSQTSIMCSCLLFNPKFTIKSNNLSNPTLCVGHFLEQTIEIKNNSKIPLIIHIKGNVLEIDEKVRINPQENKKFKVYYQAKQVGVIDGQIIIQPRGGKTKVIASKITCINPKIQFSNKLIDFGLLVVQGIPGKTTFSCFNRSPIELPLVVDLRPKKVKPQNPDDVQNISLKLKNQDISLEVVSPANKTDPAAFTKVKGGENLVGVQVDEEQFDGTESDEELVVEKNQDQYRKYRLVLKPQKQYIFELQFFPQESKNYSVTIPMLVQGSNKIQGPKIVCEGMKPQFLFEPSIIDFKKKIVIRPDRCYPKFINVVVKNLDSEDVSWQLNDQQIKKSGVFSFDYTKGLLKPLENLQFKVSFNPYAVGEFDFRLPLFIKTSKHVNPLKCIDILVKGSACLPRLYFNKRQVILPVVPLGIQTTSSFRILNDGYQNTNLKMQFLDDVAGINVRALFPEGSNIGITRQKLKVDLAWKYHKPMSFCLKLEFTDDLNRTYTIPVSGTADNCIFTNYTYLLRNENKFHIKAMPHLELFQNQQVNSSTLVRKNSNRSLRSNATGRSVMSYLGVNPISPTILANTIDYINRYINSNLLTLPISDFPNSLIEADGAQLFEIVSFVSSKNASYPWKYTATTNEKDTIRVGKIYNQYCEFIKMLKTEGAHLNHIRPEYLLSFSDLNIYLANLPEDRSQFYIPSLLKINNSLYNYLSMESWVTLLYQILKIYVLGRVTQKNIKSHLNNKLPEIPKYYLEGSNFTSQHQNILFFWVQQAILEVLLEERRLTNFDKDFRDGVAIAALIQKYANLPLLKKMKMVCTLEDDFRENAVIVCEGLQQIGLLSHISAKDIFNPLQRQMLLLILHLYVYLPFYTPKQQPVVFKCILGEEVVRSIELTNPSTKAVTYTVRYEGSEDFQLLGENKFKIQPKQVQKFEIKFISRISTAVKGRIMFINVKENTLTAAALVFELKSEIIGRTSDRIWNVSGILYEQVQFNIQVMNKFQNAEIVDFTVSYETQYIFENKPKTKQPNQVQPLPKADQIQVIYGKQDNIKIRKNSNGVFVLNYVPMSLYTTKTTILFVNTIVGEFQHQIIATVEPPATIAEIRPPMSLSVDQAVNWEYNINPKNELISKGKKAIQSIKKAKKKQTKDINKESKLIESQIDQKFKVQIAPNPYVSAKEEVVISQRKDEKKKDKQVTEIVQNQNKIPFTITCKNPVYQYTTYVLLYNKTKTDVRRYKVIFTIQPKPLKAILQMNVPARSEVTQNLPIVNNTDRDWVIKVLWQPDNTKNGGYLQLNSQYTSQFPVKRNSVGNFPIKFKPKWAYRAEAKLTMSNPLTLDNFEYDIIGIGQQPLAQEHIEIKCEAKELIKRQLIVKNPYIEKSTTFNVETDLLNWKGPTKITLAPGSKQKYQFTVQPMLCGEYTGSITFMEEDGPQYIWYTVSITTNYPQAYKTLDIVSEIRQSKFIEIEMPLKIKQPTNFQVIINGEGLNGNPTFLYEIGKNQVYRLQYLPLKIGEQKGSVCLINPQVGQTLYELNLKCIKKPPIIINNLKSPLGVSTIVMAELYNPTNYKVHIKVINSNPQLFVIKSNSMKLAAQEKLNVQIQYIPSSLQVIEATNIKFVSKEIGEWEYEISGSGQPPVPFAPYTVYNGLYQQHSDSIKFRNPFKYAIVVGIKFTSLSEPNIFKLLNHGKDRFEVDSFGILQIPFSFIPTSCKLYQCKILVMISEKIYWTFPIRGITEVNKGVIIAHLTSKSRQTVSESIQTSLEGIENYATNNQYNFQLQNIPSAFKTLCEKFLLIEATKNKLNHSKDSLEFQFVFKPMKPMKISIDFLIARKQGSRWRYKLILEATEPEPDDIIQLQSNLLVTSTISFKLTNWQKNQSTFKAKFTSDSAHQFSVEPKEGVLKGFGGKGTTFYVSFTPVEYGKDKRGKLIIQTPDMFWSYILKGSLPKYIPPSFPSRSRVQSIKK